MPVGFESVGDSGSYQVDSDFKNLAMIRSGTVNSQTYTNGETTNTAPTRVAITLNDGEILAIACTQYCAFGSRIGNVAYVYVNAAAGQAVQYYIFQSGGAAASNFGLQVFNENGELTFDAGWNLFDVRHVLSGYGSVNLPAGKKYAFVHSQIATRITYTKVVNGIAPNSFVSFVRVTDFSSVRINGGLVECQLSTVDAGGTRPSPGTGSSYTNQYNNGINPIALIIDVTGF